MGQVTSGSVLATREGSDLFLRSLIRNLPGSPDVCQSQTTKGVWEEAWEGCGEGERLLCLVTLSQSCPPGQGPLPPASYQSHQSQVQRYKPPSLYHTCTRVWLLMALQNNPLIFNHNGTSRCPTASEPLSTMLPGLPLHSVQR